MENFRKILNSMKWKYAKTYPMAPHEYTTLNYHPDKQDFFVEFAKYIRDNGREEIYSKRKYKVLDIDEYKYWTMDYYLEKTNLINRTFNNDDFKLKMIDFIGSDKFQLVRDMTLNDIKEQMDEIHS